MKYIHFDGELNSIPNITKGDHFKSRTVTHIFCSNEVTDLAYSCFLGMCHRLSTFTFNDPFVTNL